MVINTFNDWESSQTQGCEFLNLKKVPILIINPSRELRLFLRIQSSKSLLSTSLMRWNGRHSRYFNKFFKWVHLPVSENYTNSFFKIPHAFQQMLSHEKVPTLCLMLPAFEALKLKWKEFIEDHESFACIVTKGLEKLEDYEERIDFIPAYILAMGRPTSYW